MRATTRGAPPPPRASPRAVCVHSRAPIPGRARLSSLCNERRPLIRSERASEWRTRKERSRALQTRAPVRRAKTTTCGAVIRSHFAASPCSKRSVVWSADWARSRRLLGLRARVGWMWDRAPARAQVRVVQVRRRGPHGRLASRDGEGRHRGRAHQGIYLRLRGDEGEGRRRGVRARAAYRHAHHVSARRGGEVAAVARARGSIPSRAPPRVTASRIDASRVVVMSATCRARMSASRRARMSASRRAPMSASMMSSASRRAHVFAFAGDRLCTTALAARDHPRPSLLFRSLAPSLLYLFLAPALAPLTGALFSACALARARGGRASAARRAPLTLSLSPPLGCCCCSLSPPPTPFSAGRLCDEHEPARHGVKRSVARRRRGARRDRVVDAARALLGRPGAAEEAAGGVVSFVRRTQNPRRLHFSPRFKIIKREERLVGASWTRPGRPARAAPWRTFRSPPTPLSRLFRENKNPLRL